MAQQQQQGRAADRAALERSNLNTLRGMFERVNKQLEAALPKFITPDRMIRIATTTVQRVPRLLQCDPVTVVGAVMQSAQLGLEPDNITGAAYLVPFWNEKARRLECTLIPGYRGLMMLARRSREISAFDARCVHEGDLFEFEYGSRQYLRHKPALVVSPRKGDKAAEVETEPETIAAYMIAFYGKGNTVGEFPLSQFSVMLRPELDKAKQFTKSRTPSGEIVGPWIEHPDAMFTKTAIRRGAKLLPFSVDLLTAVSLDERAADGRSQNLGAIVADDLGVSFSATDDDGDEPVQIDDQLVKDLDAAFTAVNYSEARRTVKMEEYRGRLPELVIWLKAQADAKQPAAGEERREPEPREPEPAREAARREPEPAPRKTRFKF